MNPVTPVLPPFPPLRTVALRSPGGNRNASGRASRPTARLRDVIARHWLLILCCVTLGFLAAIAFVRAVRPVYKSAVSIRIDQQRHNSPVLDAFVKDMSTTDVFTEQEALESRALIEGVTDSLAVRLSVVHPTRIARSALLSEVHVDHSAPSTSYRLRHGPVGQVIMTDRATGLQLGEFADTGVIAAGGVKMRLTTAGLNALPIDLAVDGFPETVQRVLKKVQVVRPNRDANIIVLNYRGNDPDLVRDIPNAIVANFLATRRAAQKSVARSTVAFLRAELDTVVSQLATTETGFGEFRTANQVVDLAAEADSRVRHLGDFEATRNQLEADRAALKHVLDAINADSGDSQMIAARIVGYPTLFKNQAASELLHSLTEAENRRADLLLRRTTRDPDVRAETRRINELTQQLRAIATTYLEGLTQQVTAIDDARRQLGETLSTIPQRQIENTQWQRRQTMLEGIVTQLQTHLHDAQIAEAVDDPSIRVIDPAILPLAPYFPQPLVVIPAAILCGLFAGLLIAWIIESKDVTIRTRSQLGAISGLPVLAAVPRGKQRAWPLRRGEDAWKMRLGPGTHAWDAGTEAYRSLRTNIAVLRSRGAQVILVTSPSKNEGKTRTATNLAVALARQGSRVVLVDADLRRGSISELFGLPAPDGLSELLRDNGDYDQYIQTAQINDDIGLDIIGTGRLAPDAAELLQQEQLADVMTWLRSRYDIIVIDSPPLNLVTDAAIVAPLCDGVLLVARAGTTTPYAIAHSIEQLELAGGPEILGTVLNDMDAAREAHTYGAEYWSGYAQSST